MIVFVIIGFTPFLFFSSHFNKNPLPWPLIIHGSINLLWFAALFYQSWLAYKGRIRKHQKTGNYGFILAAVIVFLNGFTIFNVTQKFHAGQYSMQGASGLSLGNFTGFVIFSTIIFLAFKLRKKPEYHKRFIYLYSLSLMGFATDRIGRMIYEYVPNIPLGSIGFALFIHVIFVIALFVYDWKSLKRIHPASILALLLPFINVVLIFYLLGNGYGERFVNFFG